MSTANIALSDGQNVMFETATLANSTVTRDANGFPTVTVTALPGTSVNSVQTRNGALGPATTFTLDAPAITKESSGAMLVMISWSGTDASASDTITAQIGRDAAVLSTQVVPVGADAGGTWQFSMQFLDEAPDSSPHTYSVALTSVGNHNLSSAANRAVITVVELD